jgi:DNA-binding GntR family transcriptional regulator
LRREVRAVGESENLLERPVGSDVLMVERVSLRDGEPFTLSYSFYTRFSGTQFKKSRSSPATADRLEVTSNVLDAYEADHLVDSPHTASLVVDVVLNDAAASEVLQLHRCTFPATLLRVAVGPLDDGARPMLDVLGIGY